MVELQRIIVGPLQTNSYVLSKADSCLLIDPGSDAKADVDKIKKAINKKKLIGIIYTHHHFDHIGGGHRFDCPQYMDKEDIDSLEDHVELSKLELGIQTTLPPKLIPLIDDSPFTPFSFQIIKTPGHTKGGVCLLFDDFILTGDTLFKQAYGRVDLPEGNIVAMHASLERLHKLPGTVVVYPGHGEATTIQAETKWLKGLSPQRL